MDELTLPLLYDGEQLELPLKMYAYGYTYRMEVDLGSVVVIFEPDEEGSYRALVSTLQTENDKKVNQGLLKAIAEALEKLR